MFSDTQNNTVGPGNVIAHNGGDGVAVSGRHVSGNTVTQNSIFSNTLGIDLAYDANGGIGAPVILDVTSGPVNVIGTACPGCTVELFENDDTDGEGETFLGITTADGDGDFSLTVSSLGDPYLTATATDPVSGTSEFSAAFTASGAKRFAFLPLMLRNKGSSGGACPSPSGPTVHNGGHLTADETWRAIDGPHRVMGTITVNEWATLTIEPCAEVQLAEDVRIVVRGALAAEGAAGQPILFTALDDEPWRSIHIEYPATGSFAYATIENGGSDFVNDDGASLVAEVDRGEYPERILRQFLKVNHVTVKDSAGFGILMDYWYAGFTDDSADLTITGSGKSDPNHDHPIHIYAPALGTLPSGQYTGNVVDAIWVGDWKNRTIVADVTVQDRGVPYHIVNDVYVEPESESAPDPTLILRPGVEMRFDPDTVLHVGDDWYGGALVAEGTASQPVTFEAWDSDNPWNSIEVRYPATVSLTHVVMQDGGAERVNYEGALLFVEADDAAQGLDQVMRIVKVDHVTLKDSGGYGIFMGGLVGFTGDSTALTITGCGQDGPDTDGRFVQPIRLTAMAMGTLPSGQYTGNAADVILVFGDDGIWRDVTVRDLGAPYQLWSYHYAIDVYQDPAEGPAPTLTIEAGVEMRFEEGERLHMGTGWPSYHPGALQILGTAATPVVLTSAAAAPAPGDWIGVEFEEPGGANNSITHARIAYAGGDNGHSNYSCGVGDHGDYGAVTFFGWRPGSAFVTSSEIRHSAANGFVRGWDGKGGPDFTEDTDNTFIDIPECDQTNPKYAECPDCE